MFYKIWKRNQFLSMILWRIINYSRYHTFATTTNRFIIFVTTISTIIFDFLHHLYSILNLHHISIFILLFIILIILIILPILILKTGLNLLTITTAIIKHIKLIIPFCLFFNLFIQQILISDNLLFDKVNNIFIILIFFN